MSTIRSSEVSRPNDQMKADATTLKASPAACCVEQVALHDVHESGVFYVRFTDGGAAWCNLPPSLELLLANLAKAKTPVRDVALGDTGSWVVLYGQGSGWAAHPPTSHVAQYLAACDKGQGVSTARVTCVSLGNDGWIAIHGDGAHAGKVPLALQLALQYIRPVAGKGMGTWLQGARLEAASLGSCGSWWFRTMDGTSMWNGLDPDLEVLLLSTSSQAPITTLTLDSSSRPSHPLSPVGFYLAHSDGTWAGRVPQMLEHSGLLTTHQPHINPHLTTHQPPSPVSRCSTAQDHPTGLGNHIPSTPTGQQWTPVPQAFDDEHASLARQHPGTAVAVVTAALPWTGVPHLLRTADCSNHHSRLRPAAGPSPALLSPSEARRLNHQPLTRIAQGHIGPVPTLTSPSVNSSSHRLQNPGTTQCCHDADSAGRSSILTIPVQHVTSSMQIVQPIIAAVDLQASADLKRIGDVAYDSEDFDPPADPAPNPCCEDDCPSPPKSMSSLARKIRRRSSRTLMRMRRRRSKGAQPTLRWDGGAQHGPGAAAPAQPRLRNGGAVDNSWQGRRHGVRFRSGPEDIGVNVAAPVPKPALPKPAPPAHNEEMKAKENQLAVLKAVALAEEVGCTASQLLHAFRIVNRQATRLAAIDVISHHENTEATCNPIIRCASSHDVTCDMRGAMKCKSDTSTAPTRVPVAVHTSPAVVVSSPRHDHNQAWYRVSKDAAACFGPYIPKRVRDTLQHGQSKLVE